MHSFEIVVRGCEVYTTIFLKILSESKEPARRGENTSFLGTDADTAYPPIKIFLFENTGAEGASSLEVVNKKF